MITSKSRAGHEYLPQRISALRRSTFRYYSTGQPNSVLFAQQSCIWRVLRRVPRDSGKSKSKRIFLVYLATRVAKKKSSCWIANVPKSAKMIALTWSEYFSSTYLSNSKFTFFLWITLNFFSFAVMFMLSKSIYPWAFLTQLATMSYF